MQVRLFRLSRGINLVSLVSQTVKVCGLQCFDKVFAIDNGHDFDSRREHPDSCCLKILIMYDKLWQKIKTTKNFVL